MKKSLFSFLYRQKPLRLYWWRYQESEHGNFGDEITRLIIEKNFHRKVEWAAPSEADLVATGSILDIALEEKKDNRPYIWGSGFIEAKNTSLSYEECLVVGVRGKLTLSRITDIPEGAHISLGDPGLLADTLVKNNVITQKPYKLGIIPHYVDTSHKMIRKLEQLDDTIIIDPTSDCLEVIKTIQSCESILSSSLHGLIVADSLGVPNLHLQLSDKLKGGDYKFRDYYSVFTEDRYKKATKQITSGSVQDITHYINQHYVKPSNIDSIRSSIKASFPPTL